MSFSFSLPFRSQLFLAILQRQMATLVRDLNAADTDNGAYIPILHLAYDQCFQSIDNAVALIKVDTKVLVRKVLNAVDSGVVSSFLFLKKPNIHIH